MIIETTGDIMDYWRAGNVIGVTTNGFVKANGRCVMGAGIAKSIRDAVKDIDLAVGNHIGQNGNVPAYFPDAGIFTFPVKHVWWEQADIRLIKQSAEIIAGKNLQEFNFVRPGCGNGYLSWVDVKPVLEYAFRDTTATVWDF